MICSILLRDFRKVSGNYFSTTFCAWFFKKNVYHVIFYSLAKFHCLIAFTSWDFGQCVYCNCLLTKLGRHKFWNQPYLSNQVVFLNDQKVKTKMLIYWKRKELLRKNEKYFSIFLKDFQLPKMISVLPVFTKRPLSAETLWVH